MCTGCGYGCGYTCTCTPTHIVITGDQKRALNSLVLEVRPLKVTQCGSGDQILQEQHVILTTDPSLQSQTAILKIHTF